jgi:hypothetical protein
MRRILIAAALLFGAAVWIGHVSADADPRALSEGRPAQRLPPQRAGSDWQTCASVSDRASAPAGSSPALIEAELYQRIIDSSPHYTGPATLVVENRTIPVPQRPLDSRQGDVWSDAAAQLAWRGMFDCFSLTSDRLPRGARLVAPDVMPRNGNDLAAKFPGVVQTFSFSRAVFDQLSENAIVVYTRLCHAACGISEWVWLHKDRDGLWQIAGRTWRWIN